MKNKQHLVVRLTDTDNVVVACEPIPRGNKIEQEQVIREYDMTRCGGGLLEGRVSLHELGHRIYRHTLAVASGQRSKSDKLGIGDNKFAPWHIGAVM